MGSEGPGSYQNMSHLSMDHLGVRVSSDNLHLKKIHKNTIFIK